MFDEHQHTHVHGDGHHHDHDHAHGHGHADELTEAPLDPASQSLSDALRASFWLLKLVMIVILGCFAFSGMFIVDANEVAIVSHFGSPSKMPLRPGFHPAWPYPIDEVIRVTTSTRTLKVNDFWLVIRNEDNAKPLDQLVPRGAGLDPAVDGALLTADRAIMHASFRVEYRVPESEAVNYVTNVRDDEALLRAVIKEAAVAEAARTTADVVWRDPKALAVLEPFTRAAKANPERDAAERAVATLRAAKKPADDLRDLRHEVLGLQKENRELRKQVDDLKRQFDSLVPRVQPIPDKTK